jgi:hypothetical protein
MDTVDLRARDVARDQYGRASRQQLRERAGISRSTITRRVRSGVWSEPVPGVVDLGTHPETWRGRISEVLLAAGPAAWASHRTAAHLHRFLDVRRPPAIDVLVPRTRHRRVGHHRLHAASAIGLDEVTTRYGLACTSRARTLLDLGATSSPDDLERWLADGVRRDPDLVRQVVELCDRHRRLPGRRRLLDVLARLPAGAGSLGSALEVLRVQQLVRLGAPPFVLQYTVRDLDGAPIKRVDVAWPERRRLLEFDGAAYHDLTHARAEDESTRTRIRAAGWTLDVIRRADLGGPAMGRLVRELRGGS